MTDTDECRTCTAAERTLLDMIACWPGVPAVVTIHEDGRYSASTPEGWGKGIAINARATALFAPCQDVVPVSHDRAEVAARRLIGSHFGLAGRAQMAVPPRKREDDDFVLMAYIRQQRGGEEASSNGEATMTHDELAAIVEARLDPALRAKPGAMLLSGPATIAPGKFYVMGINPGGGPKVLTASVGENLAPADGASSYTDECWNKQCGDNPACEHMENGRVRPEAWVRHQRNIMALARMLGRDTPATLPSANAIFGRSTSLATLEKETGFNAGRWWQGCWPVHQALLEIVRPAVIITLDYGMNTSAFGFLAALAKPAAFERLGNQNRRGGKTFTCPLDLGSSTLDTRVIGVPHPSYYAPGDLLAGELRALAGAA